MSRILLAVIGSLGDIHPMIAIGLALQKRGHQITFATSEVYRGRLEKLGFKFERLRPDNIRPDDSELLARLMDLTEGTGRLLRDQIFAYIRDTYEDLCRIGADADGIVVSELVYAGRLLAESKNIPWAFLALSPSTFFSAYDMPVLPGREAFSVLHKFGPRCNKFLIDIGQWNCASWSKIYHQLRRELSLPLVGNPIFYAKYSPYLVLAAFSPLLGAKQPDWPASTVQTGFAYHDSVPDLFDQAKVESAIKLRHFLEAGDAPLVFTLGSAAMFAPGKFYEESLEAAHMLNRRAVFLMGQNALFENLPSSMIALDYAPFQDIFPHASAVVHQGGIGTCAQALRFGKPTLCVPYSHDQPDNAQRLMKLGTSLTLKRKDYRAALGADKLKLLTTEPAFSQRAQEAARLMKSENGADKAADEIEKMLIGRSQSGS